MTNWISDETSLDAAVPSESKYLRKEDVTEEGVIVTIKGIAEETIEADGEQKKKAVMYFVENLKPMVLNVTNRELIKLATGARNSGEARGKKIVVYNDPSVPYAGKIVGGLRIRKAQGQPKPAAAVDTDDVPF